MAEHKELGTLSRFYAIILWRRLARPLKMKSIFLVLVLSFLAFELGSAQCPPPILIHPCTCEGPIPIVICTRISDVHTLEDVFSRSADRKFYIFALNDSSVIYLPAHGISQKNFVNLMLKNVTMSAMFDRPPDPDNKVNIIILHDVKFQRGVGWELFGPMRNLELVTAENTEIKSLGKSFVDNINEGLTNLIFSNTKTRKIQYNAFAKLTKLFDLEIMNGDVRSLLRSMFAKPSALEEIDFSGNKITQLPEDIFSDMPVLKKVNFSGNRITLLSQAVFGGVVERQGRVNLEGNPLKCDCSMFWYVSRGRKRLMTGRCASPLDQEGKLLQHLTTKDLDYCA